MHCLVILVKSLCIDKVAFCDVMDVFFFVKHFRRHNKTKQLQTLLTTSVLLVFFTYDTLKLKS